MGKIEVMDHALANQIAAGEVVERPASVVKELIENAIDAHAKNIRVSVFNAGRTKIVVEDDGEGMDRVDALLAFKRHATSKLKKTLGLFRIKTLGFRGEALPSIASVSKLTLVTSTGSGTGTEIVLEDEQEIVKDASLRKGTIVTVEELFYNTPARLKYLKTDYTENAATTEIVSRLALAHPDVAFSFSLDDRIQFETTGRGELLEVILTIYGHGVASKMIPFSFETNDFAVFGFLGKAELAKSNRYYIITLLNGRNVYMPKVQAAVIDAYHDFIPPTRYPFVIINFVIDHSLVDVNVHPSKREVRFSKELELRLALLEHIPTALRKSNLIVDVDTTRKVVQAPVNEVVHQQLSLDISASKVSESAFENLPMPSTLPLKERDEEIISIPKYVTEASPKRVSLKAIAQMHQTYIIADDLAGGFYLVDQHAANERINYEEFQKVLLNQMTVMEPLFPQVIHIHPSDMLRLTNEKLELLRATGIELEPFGLNTFKVIRVPTWAKSYDEKVYIEDLLDQVLHGDKLDLGKLRTHAIATMACKASIKANDYLSIVEMQYLLDRLMTCDNPYACPHGRPTVIHYNKYELEKLFKRTGV